MIYIPLEWQFCQNRLRLISNLLTRATIKFSQAASLISAVASFSKLRRFLAVVSLETRALRKLARSLLILEVLLVAFCSARNFNEENQLNPLKSPICPPFFFYTEPSAPELAVSQSQSTYAMYDGLIHLCYPPCRFLRESEFLPAENVSSL